jgi:hypothetical protein
MNEPETGNPHVLMGLGLYLLGALGTDECAVIDRHLATCQGCRSECDELRKVTALLTLLSPADVDALAEELRG